MNHGDCSPATRSSLGAAPPPPLNRFNRKRTLYGLVVAVLLLFLFLSISLLFSFSLFYLCVLFLIPFVVVVFQVYCVALTALKLALWTRLSLNSCFCLLSLGLKACATMPG